MKSAIRKLSPDRVVLDALSNTLIPGSLICWELKIPFTIFVPWAEVAYNLEAKDAKLLKKAFKRAFSILHYTLNKRKIKKTHLNMQKDLAALASSGIFVASSSFDVGEVPEGLEETFKNKMGLGSNVIILKE